MLTLNSQYARTFVRKESKNRAYQYPEKSSSQNRGFTLSQANSRPLRQVNSQRESWIDRGCEFQSNLHGSRRTNLIKAKSCLSEIELTAEGNGKYRYSQPQQVNDNSFSKSPRLNPTRMQPINALFNREERQEFIVRGKYERLDKMPNHPVREPLGQKNDFVGNHSKRNEDLRNKMGQPESYNNRNSRYCNDYRPSYFAKDQHLMQKQMKSNQAQGSSRRKNFEKDEFHEQQHQKFVRRPNLDEQCPKKDLIETLKNNEDSSKYSNRLSSEEQTYAQMNIALTERYSGNLAQLYQRNKNQQKQIQQTPSRFNKNYCFQPGSAENKRSLIEKSQMLQQKLKKLTSSQARFAQLDHTSRSGPEQAMHSKFTPRYRDQNYNSNASARNNQVRQLYHQNTAQQMIKQSQGERNVEAKRVGKNSDLLSTPSPIQSIKSSGSQEQAIEKIMQLNEKINERIQSIIANYSKK